jgi:hypothetical protein
VARSLYDAGWNTLPRSLSVAGWTCSYNWYTVTYVSYVELLRRWAEEVSSNPPVAPDEIERALFDGR